MMTTYDQLIEKGLQKGKQEGIRIAQREIILKGYDKGLSVSFLASLSGLPKEEVNEIIQEHHKK